MTIVCMNCMNNISCTLCIYDIHFLTECSFVCLFACLFVCLLYFFNLLDAYHHFLQTSGCPFAQMDVNGDGVLSREEFVAAMR